MGATFSSKKTKIVILGLDNAGKSTLVKILKPHKVN